MDDEVYVGLDMFCKFCKEEICGAADGSMLLCSCYEYEVLSVDRVADMIFSITFIQAEVSEPIMLLAAELTGLGSARGLG